MTTKQEQIDTLETRLYDGFEKIGRALQNGLTVDNWTDHWIELLREYEQLADDLAAAPLEQTEMPGLPRKEAEAA